MEEKSIFWDNKENLYCEISSDEDVIIEISKKKILRRKSQRIEEKNLSSGSDSEDECPRKRKKRALKQIQNFNTKPKRQNLTDIRVEKWENDEEQSSQEINFVAEKNKKIIYSSDEEIEYFKEAKADEHCSKSDGTDEDHKKLEFSAKSDKFELDEKANEDTTDEELSEGSEIFESDIDKEKGLLTGNVDTENEKEENEAINESEENEKKKRKREKIRQELASITRNLRRDTSNVKRLNENYVKYQEKSKVDDESKEDEKFEKATELYQPLIQNLREKASRPDLTDREIINEWVIHGNSISYDCKGKCACGKKGLKYLNHMINKNNEIFKITIGSECINHFAENKIAFTRVFNKLLMGRKMTFVKNNEGSYHFDMNRFLHSDMKYDWKQCIKDYKLPIRTTRTKIELPGDKDELDGMGSDGFVEKNDGFFRRKQPSHIKERLRVRAIADQESKFPYNGLIKNRNYTVALKMEANEIEDDQKERRVVTFIIVEIEEDQSYQTKAESAKVFFR